ncbi:MAG: hypothetical protein D8B48_07440 [Granulicatella sp.]|nr:MAG: hypothetical protein D8B48_07440 [Granulicatella sp.]
MTTMPIVPWQMIQLFHLLLKFKKKKFPLSARSPAASQKRVSWLKFEPWSRISPVKIHEELDFY